MGAVPSRLDVPLGPPNSAGCRYPRWTKLWLQKLPDVDRVIEHFFRFEAEYCDLAATDCARHIEHWFDRLPLDNHTRAEFEAAKADPVLLRAQVQVRVRHLLREDRIRPTSAAVPALARS